MKKPHRSGVRVSQSAYGLRKNTCRLYSGIGFILLPRIQQMEIYSSRLQLCMSQGCLHIDNVSAGLQHHTGKSVAQIMGTQCRQPSPFPNHFPRGAAGMIRLAGLGVREYPA